MDDEVRDEPQGELNEQASELDQRTTAANGQYSIHGRISRLEGLREGSFRAWVLAIPIMVAIASVIIAAGVIAGVDRAIDRRIEDSVDRVMEEKVLTAFDDLAADLAKQAVATEIASQFRSDLPFFEGFCDPAYPDFCLASPPPDLDCSEIPVNLFQVLPPDPHNLDPDQDGIGCEG